MTSASPDASLAQIGPSTGYPSFTVRVYVTSRTGDPASTLWFTGVTTWQSQNARNAGRVVSVRTLIHLGG